MYDKWWKVEDKNCLSSSFIHSFRLFIVRQVKERPFLWLTGERRDRGKVTAMFMGEYYHSLDAKGRLIIPAKLRDKLGDEFVVTRGFDGSCLSIYPLEEWGKLEEKLKMIPKNDKAGRVVIRHLTAGATMCEVDKQGRILIPQVLREHAHLEKEAVLVGMLERVEIWDKQSYEDNSADNIDEALASLEASGIQI